MCVLCAGLVELYRMRKCHGPDCGLIRLTVKGINGSGSSLSHRARAHFGYRPSSLGQLTRAQGYKGNLGQYGARYGRLELHRSHTLHLLSVVQS
jgi:hypothetical protein